MSQASQTLSSGQVYHDRDYDYHLRNVERRIVLIGKTGTGKSTLGNAILGAQTFKTDGLQMMSNTEHCQLGRSKSNNGKEILVVDTPGLMDTRHEENKIIEELCKCTMMTSPGPHVFCLVINGTERFTRENIDTLNKFCDFFGEDIYKYMIVVFTHKAGSKEATNDCIRCLPASFQEKLLQFGSKSMVIESKASEKEMEEQMKTFFTFVEEIITRNNGGFYSGEKFQAAEKTFRERARRIQELKEKKLQEYRKSLEAEYNEKNKQSTERENALRKKLQDERKNFELELSNKSRENVQNSIKALEKQLKEEIKQRDDLVKVFLLKIEEKNREALQDLHASIIEDRNKVRDEIQRKKISDFVGTAAVIAGTLALTVITGGIGGAVGAIGVIGGCIVNYLRK